MASAVVVLSTGRLPAQDREASAKSGDARAKADRAPERASGVIIKVEPVTRGRTSGSSTEKNEKGKREARRAIRLTINTAAVWRDWARDQATNDAAKESPRKAAETGDKSVATRGEPATKDDTVVIHLNPDSQVETRFRAPDDETSKGSKTPADAEAKEVTSGKPDASKSKAAKPVKFTVADLRPGLFVEIDFRPMRRGNLASSITVIRPVGVAAASPAGAGK